MALAFWGVVVNFRAFLTKYSVLKSQHALTYKYDGWCCAIKTTKINPNGMIF